MYVGGSINARSPCLGDTSSSEAQTSRLVASPTQQLGADEGTVLPEGPISLSAHSTRAITLLDTMAGAGGQGEYSLETQELIESLRQIVKAIKTPPAVAPTAMMSIRMQQKPASFEMPPIQASVAAIRAAQGRHPSFPV